MQKYIKSFWDTDFESDIEFTPASRKGIDKKFKENNNTGMDFQIKRESDLILLTDLSTDHLFACFLSDAGLSVGYKTAFQGSSNMNTVNNATMINTMLDSTQKLNTNSMFKLCSHRNSKPKKIACEKANASTTQIKSLTSKQKNTKSNICLEVTELENYTQPANKKPDKPKLEKQKHEKKKSPPKKQSKAKAVKNNTTVAAANDQECKTVNGINDKILGEENTKKQKQKTKNVQSKKESKDGLDKNNIKKSATASQNKIENNLNETKQRTHDKLSQNLNKDEPNSLIYEDSFTETNNYSRPIRSCRLSKQNSSLYTSKVNQSLNMTLRSRQKKPHEKIPDGKKPDGKKPNEKKPDGKKPDGKKPNEKIPDGKKPNEKKPDKKNPAAKISTSTDQANLSNLSLSLAQKKPISRIMSRLKETKRIDFSSDSDISFSLTDKDSHLKSRGKSAKFIEHARNTHTPNIKEFVYKEPRPVRTSRLNKKYFS